MLAIYNLLVGSGSILMYSGKHIIIRVPKFYPHADKMSSRRKYELELAPFEIYIINDTHSVPHSGGKSITRVDA